MPARPRLPRPRVATPILAALLATLQVPVAAKSIAEHPIADAVSRGDCDGAVKAVNDGVSANDAQALLLAGQMLDYGVCVKADHAGATRMYERGAELGDGESALAFAGKLGMGVGVDQDYQRAGEICRLAGIDPNSTLDSYELGYACTVRAIAAERTRDGLPHRAFQPGSSATALVDFDPSSGAVTVRVAPNTAREADAPTGSNLRRSRRDVRHAIEDGWQAALVEVPKPDPGRLVDKTVEMPLELSTPIDPTRTVTAPASDNAFLRMSTLHQFQAPAK